MANFATLDSLKKEDEEKEKQGNAYYAGGARGAGQGGRYALATSTPHGERSECTLHSSPRGRQSVRFSPPRGREEFVT